jgi:predicted histone-like DNA-binding protein
MERRKYTNVPKLQSIDSTFKTTSFMAAKYDFKPMPHAKGDDKPQLMYPRIVNKGTIDTERLVSDISHMSSFTPGDIKGLLAAFEDRISYYLSEGHHVQMGNMGFFSAGLTARPVEDKGEIHAQSISFGKVNFRVSPAFRKQCGGFLERVRPGYGFRQSQEVSGGERYRRLTAYLDTHPFITRKEYSGITGLLKNKALNDLNLLVNKGYLETMGRGSHKVYVRPMKQEVTEENC